MEDGSLRQRSRKFETDKDEAIRKLTETLDSLRKTQEHLVRTERYQALAQMGSGVAHDFNNSLTKMVGIIELMIEDAPGPSQPLQQLRTTVLEAAKIVQRLRAFYHPIQTCVDVDPIDLNAVIAAAADMTRPRWKTQCEVNGNPIEMNLNLDVIPPVMGKFEELREAIVNLLLNACDAMPEGGMISVTTKVVEESVVISISDTGVGMADIVRKRCLEPYFTTKGKSHLGLGLGLVNRLLRSLGGTMNMQSELGVGSAVILSLPVHSPAKAEPAPGEGSGDTAAALPPLHILVVDDDLAIRVLIAQFLRLDGHEVDLAKNGMDALEKFDPARHQLVISDRAMPVLNGDQLALGIKARAATTPVIMASGYVDAFTTDRDRPHGVDLLLAKPITRDSLRTALVSAMKSPPRVLQNSS